MQVSEQDFGAPHRQALIQSSKYLEQQRQKALKFLGPRWLLHPANRVQKCIQIEDAATERKIANAVTNIQDFTHITAADDVDYLDIPAFLRRQAD